MPQGTVEFDEELLWSRHREKSDPVARTTLVENYTSLVRKIAASFYAKRPDDEVAFDDLYQFGAVGLIESVDRYQPDKGASFETYASYRIRGAILNAVEKMSERRDQNACRARLHKERIESLSGKEASKKNHDTFEQMVEVTLGLAIGFMLEDTGIVQDKDAASADHAYQAKKLADLKQCLLEAVNQLPERESFIIQRHYFYHDNFETLSEKLNITKGRISQIHKRALQKVRKQLKGGDNLDDYF